MGTREQRDVDFDGDAHRAAALTRQRGVRYSITCGVALVVLYALAVWTPLGQRFEDRTLDAAAPLILTNDALRAVDTLNTMSPMAMLAILSSVTLIGTLRGGWRLGRTGLALMLAPIVAAEIGRRVIPRPILLAHGIRRLDQSFPSGHTVGAAAVLCALLLVVAPRWRVPLTIAVSVWSVSVAVATVTANWHRTSDTLGSDLLAVGATGLAVAFLATPDAVGSAGTSRPRKSIVRIGLMSLGIAAVALDAVAVVYLSWGTPGPAILTAAHLITTVGAAAVGPAALLLLRRVDFALPP